MPARRVGLDPNCLDRNPPHQTSNREITRLGSISRRGSVTYAAEFLEQERNP
jgi:hypothetical protein